MALLPEMHLITDAYSILINMTKCPAKSEPKPPHCNSTVSINFAFRLFSGLGFIIGLLFTGMSPEGKELRGHNLMNFTVRISSRSDGEVFEKGEGTPCDAYINWHTFNPVHF